MPGTQSQFDPNAGYQPANTAPTAAGFDPNAAYAADSSTKATPDSAAKRFKDSFLSALGVTTDEGAKKFFLHPIKTFMDSMNAQGDLAIKAKEAYAKGDYKAAVQHGLNYMIPFIGQNTDRAGEQLKGGDIAGGVGTTLGTAAPIIAVSPEVRAIPGRISPQPIRPVYPGASLPANPTPELMQSHALAEGGKAAPVPMSQVLERIPVKPTYPGAPLPIRPPLVEQAAPLGKVPVTGALPASQTGEALATIPSPKIGEVAPPPQAAATVEPTPAPSPAREAAPPSEVTLTGESALRKILTGQDNANLMKIAKSRGINVINKIIESHSEEELQNVRDMYLENSRFKHSFGDIGPEAWKALSMQSYFPDVKIPATVLKRMESAIKTARPVAEAPAASTDDLMPQLQKSLEMAKKLRASQTQ